MNRQYIGARYVPTFANPVEWDDLREYEALTIVTYKGTSYTSKQTVPVGTPLNNTDYWVVTGNYNAQVEQYREEVSTYKTEVNTYKTEVDNLNESVTKINATQTLRNKKILILGDSISDEDLFPNNWVKYFKERVHPSNTVTNMSLQGRTIGNVTGSNNNLNNVTSTITERYDKIIVFLGVNDWHNQVPIGRFNSGDNNTVCGALKNFATWASRNQPSAEITFITPLKSKINDFTGHKLLQFYVSCICANAAFFGWQVIDAHSYAPFINPNATVNYTRDGIHPTDDYSPYFSDYIYDNFEKEVSSVGCEFNTDLGIGDVGGSSNRISCNIDSKGNLGFNINNFTISTNGSVKLADIPEECMPAISKIGTGVIKQADNNFASVFLTIVGTALYVSNPNGVVGDLYGSINGMYTQWSLSDTGSI